MKKKLINLWFKLRITLVLFVALFLFPKQIYSALKSGKMKAFNSVINNTLRK